MSHKKLVAVVVTYNRLPHLQTAINALAEQPCDAVVVVDNCSTDGTREWLANKTREFDKLDIVLASGNLGGAGGFELGFRHAMRAYDPDWIVCFDDDAYPNPGALQAFLDSDLERVDAAAAAVYFPSGAICEMNRPAINPFWNWRRFLKTVFGQGRQGFHLSNADYHAHTAIPIDTTSFVGFFIRGSVVHNIGFPEGRLFIYGDDVLYALTVRRAGHQICFLPWVRFTHDCAVISAQEKTITPLWKIYYIFRNNLRVYHTAAGWLFWLFMPIKVAQWLLNARHYEQPGTYLRLALMALKDAACRRYDRSHESIVARSLTATKRS